MIRHGLPSLRRAIAVLLAPLRLVQSLSANGLMLGPRDDPASHLRRTPLPAAMIRYSSAHPGDGHRQSRISRKSKSP